MRKLSLFIRKEPVLSASFFFALISMCFVPPSIAYVSYIDTHVLILLFCLMLVVAGLQKYLLFDALAVRLLSGKRTLRTLIWLLTILPFFSAMLVTNDVALIAFVPFAILVLNLIGQSHLLIPVIVLQSIAANLGSMATPVGNPQNLFLYAAYDLSIVDFLQVVLPFVGIGFIFLSFFALCRKSVSISVHFPDVQTISQPKQILICILLFILCLLSVFHILSDWLLLSIVCIVVMRTDSSLFEKIDFGLLLTFICFFIFAGNIGSLSTMQALFSHMTQSSTFFTALLASQVMSNVPAAVLLESFTSNWTELLLGVNLGGLGTPIASLASLIALRFYAQTPHAKIGRYLLIFSIYNLLALLIFFPFFSYICSYFLP